MKTKVIIVVLVAVLIFIQYRLWFAKNGLLTVFRLKDAIAAHTERNDRLRHENDNLIAEIKELKSGGAAIEKHARKDLGMVKEDEVFYRTVNN